jgi:sugar/nucleoside kinase (ribokinase family)
VPYKILSLGDLVADIVVSLPSLPVEAGAHQIARQIRLEPGGAGNLLIAGARLGMRMVALGAMGDDPFGAAALELLAREGVEVGGVLRQPGSTTTTVVVLVDERGQHVFVGGHGLGPALPVPESWRAALEGAQAVFVSGYTLAEERLADAALEITALARARGIPTFFDPGPEMSAATAEQRAIVVANSSVLLMTEGEIPLMTGGPSGLDQARALLQRGPRMVCVKRGPQGCVIFTPEGEASHSGYPVPVRDTAAAGDSFNAAFIFACLRGWPLLDLAAFANAMGAAKVQKVGSGTQVPSADEVRAVLRQSGSKLDF